jgi:predicted acyltransferase
LLLGYWALLAWVPIPGFGAGNFTEGHNLTNYLDKIYLGGRKYDGNHDPEGLLSSLPAIATCLFGVLAGVRLKHAKPGALRGLELIAGGAALIALGWVWGWEFPIIKKLWTSSYVLFAAGWSAVAFGLFYLVIDAAQVRKWAMPFVWIGMNPILLYLLDNLAPARGVATRLVGGDAAGDLNLLFMPGSGDFLVACVASGISIWVAWFLYHRRIFIRV